MESLAILVPFEIELDWARVARAAARVVAILVVGALAYVALRVVRNRVGRRTSTRSATSSRPPAWTASSRR